VATEIGFDLFGDRYSEREEKRVKEERARALDNDESKASNNI
jgi:hypothetical protein